MTWEDVTATFEEPEENAAPQTGCDRQEFPDVGGISDAIIENSTSNNLHIWDYKDGQNLVSPEQNAQLMFYALLYTPDLLFESYTFTICQPKCREAGEDANQSWLCGRDTMVQFKEDVIKALELVKQAEAEIKDAASACSPELSQNYFADGDHCRWCPCKSTCPLKVQEFGELPLDAFPDDVPVGKSAGDLTPEELASLIPREKHVLDFVKSWFGDLKSRGMEMIRNGEELPGLKMVESLGNRKWNDDEDKLIKRLSSLKIPKAAVTVTKLMSPAQVEKVANPKWVAKYTTRSVAGISLVPEDDPREAVNSLAKVQSEFGELPVEDTTKESV